MEPASLRQIIALLILLLLSAFFSMCETALISINKIRLRHMIEEKVKGAEAVKRVLADQKKLLTTILIGNNIANISASSLTTVIVIRFFNGRDNLIAFFTVLLTLVILLFSEIIPKSVAASNSEKISLLIAKPIHFFLVVFKPISFILNIFTSFVITILGGNADKIMPLITEEELKTVVEVSHEEGVLEVEERKMINNVFEFGDYCAKDLMTTRTDIVALPIGSSIEEIRETFMTERFTRLPVYKESTDNIVGILHLKDFVFFNESGEGFNLEARMREPYFTYETKPASELFMIMRTKRIPIAIVIDEYGGTAGLITLEDLIEEIVGDISDEYDELETDIEFVKDDEFIVEGGTKISDVNEMVGIKLESEEFDSIGGYVMGAIGRIPIKGDVVDFNNYKFQVEETDRNRVIRLRILKNI